MIPLRDVYDRGNRLRGLQCVARGVIRGLMIDDSRRRKTVIE